MARVLFICSVYILGIDIMLRVLISAQENPCVCTMGMMDCSSKNLSDFSRLKECTPNSSSIDLSDNRLPQFPNNLGSSLDINIARNELFIINVTDKQNVKVLNVNSNKIRQIIFGQYFENLRFLQASHNQLNETSNFIQGQCNLTAMFVPYNGLSSLLAATFCKQLDTLDASHNMISFLPNSMIFMKNLTRLYLSHNEMFKISHIPSQLQLLDVSYNQLETVPDFQNVTQLRILILSNNKIKYVDQQTHLPLPALAFVNLSVNELQVIDDSFNWMINSRQVDLSHNLIESVATILNQWNFLETLDLSNNSISDAPILSQTWELKLISLANNKIKKITFEQMNSLLGWRSQNRFVDLSGNALDATSDLQSLVKRMGVSRITFFGAQCACAEVTRKMAVLRFCVENPVTTGGCLWFLDDERLSGGISINATCLAQDKPSREPNVTLVIILLSVALLLAAIALSAAVWSLHAAFFKREPVKIVTEFSKTHKNYISPRGFDHVQYMRKARSVEFI